MERAYCIAILGLPLIWSWSRGHPVMGPVAGLLVPFLIELVAQAIFAADMYLNAGAMTWLILFMYCFVAGYVLTFGASGESPRSYSAPNICFRSGAEKLGRVIVLMGLANVVIFAALSWYEIFVLQYGVGSDGIFRREEFMKLATAGPIGIGYRAMQLFMYLAVAPLYLYSKVDPRKGRWALGLFVCAAAMQSLVTTSKMGILLVLMIWLSCWSVHLRKGLRQIRLRIVLSSIASVILAAALMLAIMAVRYDLDKMPGDWFVRKMLIYLAGSPSAWSMEYSLYGTAPRPDEFGVTVRGLLEVLGIAEREVGVYSFVRLDSGYLGSDSNVYTGFRLLIGDFGFPGTAAVMFCIGSLMAWLEVKHLRRPTATLFCLQSAILILVYWLSVTLMSYYNVFLFLLLESIVIGAVFRFRSSGPVNA